MFTTRLQRFKRHPTLVTLEQNGKQHEKKKKKKNMYIYTYLARFYASNTRCFVRVTSRARTGNNSRRTKRHDTSGRHRPPLPFRPSAFSPAHTVAALNFSAIFNYSPKALQNIEPERLVRLHIFHRARLILSRGVYDLRCDPKQGVSAFASLHICRPPRERFFPGTCLLYFCCPPASYFPLHGFQHRF